MLLIDLQQLLNICWVCLHSEIPSSQTTLINDADSRQCHFTAVQIVTHLCYSDFEDILPAIDGLEGAQQSLSLVCTVVCLHGCTPISMNCSCGCRQCSSGYSRLFCGQNQQSCKGQATASHSKQRNRARMP